jgi:hypothetical protein
MLVEELKAAETIFPAIILKMVCSNWYQVQIRRMPCSVTTARKSTAEPAAKRRIAETHFPEPVSDETGAPPVTARREWPPAGRARTARRHGVD